MKEPKRLRQRGADRITTLLLDAGRTDGPPKARLDRMLGVGGAAGVGLAAGTAAAGAAGPAAKSALGIALVLKWLAVGAFAGLAVSAGASQVSGVATGEASIAVAPPPGVDERRAPKPAAPAKHVEPPTVVEPPATNAVSVHRAESPRSNRASAPRKAPVPAQTEAERAASVSDQATSPEALALREEVVTLGRAKAALNRGAASEALSLIRDYRARFPFGRLGPEAAYIEMEAELASGNRARAEAIAGQLASGTTPNAERARAILNGGKP